MNDAHDPFGLTGCVLEGRYRIDRVVGEGGFGVVYKAAHLDFGGTPVAVKCLKVPHGFTTEGRQAFVENFRREGALLLPLGATPGVVRVLAFGMTAAPGGGEVPFLVLEWLEGRSLEAVLAARQAKGLGAFGEREALTLLRPVVDAIASAHALPHAAGRGVAHRDLKPANIMEVETHRGVTWKVLDFGIAKAMQEGETVTQLKTRTSSGVSAFSPCHGAPEQFQAKHFGPTGPWTDVHALALILVELLTGRPALDGDELYELFASATAGTRPTPRARGALVSDACEALCARALALLPGERFADAGEMLAALDGALADATTAAPTMPMPPPLAETQPLLSAPVAVVTAPPVQAVIPAAPRRSPGKKRGRIAAVGVAAPVVALLSALLWMRSSPCEEGDAGQCSARCSLGNAVSCRILGEMTFEGRGATRSDEEAAALYDRACDGSDADGCAHLALAYRDGRGVERDLERSYSLLDSACEAGSALGCDWLGEVHWSGIGRQNDDASAVAYYRRACDAGLGAGCLHLAGATTDGRGVEKNETRSWELGQRGANLSMSACEGGDLRSCTRLGAAHWEGRGVPKDDGRAAELFREACEGGYPNGCAWLGRAHWEGRGAPKDDGRAAELFRKACEGGSMGGCASLGSAHWEGRGVAKDDGRAAELYRKACDGGCMWACSSLGIAHWEGRGVPKDDGRAAALFSKACEGGDVGGCSWWGVAHWEGRGVPKDEARAAELLRKACDGGNMGGCSWLASAHWEGRGVPKDEARAAELWGKACDGGYGNGCTGLGSAHWEGRGVPKDDALAAKLWGKACEGGDMWSCRNLGDAHWQGRGVAKDDARAALFYLKACDGGGTDGCTLLKQRFAR